MSETAKHTPGPWKNIEWVCHAPTTIVDETGEVIAETSGFGRSSNDCVADAKLIAESPEMYKALQSAEMALVGFINPNEVIKNALHNVRQVLTKVRGY